MGTPQRPVVRWIDIYWAVIHHRRKRGRYDSRGVAVMPHICTPGGCPVVRPWPALQLYICLNAGVIAHECRASHQSCEFVSHTRGIGDACAYSGLVLSQDYTITEEDARDMLRRGLLSHETPVYRAPPVRASVRLEAGNAARAMWVRLMYSPARAALDAGVAQRIKAAVATEAAHTKKTLDLDRLYAFVLHTVPAYRRYVCMTMQQRIEADVRAGVRDALAQEFEALADALSRNVSIVSSMLPGLFLAFVYDRERKWRQNRPKLNLDLLLPRIRDLDSIGVSHASMQAHASILAENVVCK